MFFMQDTVFDTIVLDGSLNPQRVNFPANVELDTNLTYDQITLFSKLLECAETLQWYTDGQTHNIETTK